MKKICFLVFVIALSIASSVYADTVNGNFTSDNHYSIYISTDDSVAGTPVGNSNVSEDSAYPYDWGIPESWNITLTPGVTNYLHVYAWDDGGSGAGVLGSFSLNGSNFRFENGTQSIYTTTQDYWKVHVNGFGGTDITSNLTDEGGIGVAPWGNPNGNFNVFDANSRWLWTDYVTSTEPNDQGAHRYFSVKINAVPEPVSTVLFLLGGATLAVRRVYKSKKS